MPVNWPELIKRKWRERFLKFQRFKEKKLYIYSKVYVMYLCFKKNRMYLVTIRYKYWCIFYIYMHKKKIIIISWKKNSNFNTYCIECDPWWMGINVTHIFRKYYVFKDNTKHSIMYLTNNIFLTPLSYFIKRIYSWLVWIGQSHCVLCNFCKITKIETARSDVMVGWFILSLV